MLAAAGVALVAGRDRWLDALLRWLAQDPAPPYRFAVVLIGLAATIVLPLTRFAGYLWRLGSAARGGGRLARILAVVLALAACVMLALLWRLFARLGAPDFRPVSP